MKEIHTLLNEINNVKSEFVNEIMQKYSICNHPAKELDDYMKEQYAALLFSILKESTVEEEKAIAFLFYVSEQIGFQLIPEDIVKYVYKLDENRLNDCAISFENEDIKYLLGFELTVLLSLMAQNNEAKKYFHKLIDVLSINEEEIDIFTEINDVIIKNNLSCFKIKKFIPYSRIFKCYLYRFNFLDERCLVVSNCLPKVRNSDCSRSYKEYAYASFAPFAEGFFESEYNVREYKYVEKGNKLGNFVVRVFGFSMGMFSKESWDESEENENKFLKSPKFKSYEKFLYDYCDNNTYEMVDLYAEKSGIFVMFCNCIDKYNLPIAVIMHPLDSIEESEKYFEEKYVEILNKEEE